VPTEENSACARPPAPDAAMPRLYARCAIIAYALIRKKRVVLIYDIARPPAAAHEQRAARLPFQSCLPAAPIFYASAAEARDALRAAEHSAKSTPSPTIL